MSMKTIESGFNIWVYAAQKMEAKSVKMLS